MAHSGRPTLAALGPESVPALPAGRPDAAAMLRGAREGWNAVAELAAARVWTSQVALYEHALIEAVARARAATTSQPYSVGFKKGAYAAIAVLTDLTPAEETTAEQTTPEGPAK